jgi:hypothetical protein
MAPSWMMPGGMVPGGIPGSRNSIMFPAFPSGKVMMRPDLQDFLVEEFPGRFERWVDLCVQGGPEAERECQEIQEFARGMMRLREENPEAFEAERETQALERRSHELGERVRHAEDAKEREDLRLKLTEVLEELFDIRENRREKEAEEIERELKRIRAMLEKRQGNRAKIIKRRIADLTGEGEALEW